MSGNIVNKPRPNKIIDIILDKVYNQSVPKPVKLRPDTILNILETVIVFLILVNSKR